MLGPVSIGTQQDIDTAMRLVQLLSDPAACTARLDELKQAAAAANELIAAANAKDVQSSARETDSMRILQSATQIERSARATALAIDKQTKQAQGRVTNDRTKLDSDRVVFEEDSKARTDALGKGEERLRVEENLFASRVAAFDDTASATETNLAKREKELDAREAALKHREADTEALHLQHEQKIAALRSIVG